MHLPQIVEKSKTKFKTKVKWLVWSGIIALVGVVGWFLYIRNFKKSSDVVAVPIVPVKLGDVEITINQGGTVELGGQQSLKSPGEVAVERVLVKLGDRVRVGHPQAIASESGGSFRFSRWDLNLDAGLTNATNDSADMKVGLSLTRKIGDLSIEQKFERSRVNLLKAQNSLEDSRETLEIQVTDRIRDINLSLSQLELARNETQLSERQLAIEQEKLKLGRSNTLDIISLQNALAQARNNELNATIAYLNALTNLDQILGTTLQTWQVTIKQ
ncbi:MAG: TolC family protein [Heteroscytonema crispum UTEX LB 1556]